MDHPPSPPKGKYVSLRYDELLPNKNTTVDQVNALLRHIDCVQSTKRAQAKLLKRRSLLARELEHIHAEAAVEALHSAALRRGSSSSEQDDSAIDDEVKDQLLRWSYSEDEILEAYREVVDKGNIMCITNAIENRRRSTSTTCSSVTM